MIDVGPEEFEALVVDALDQIPEGLLALMDNVAVFIEDDPPPEEPDLLGLYDGVPLTERDDYGGLVLPDRVFIYRNPLCSICHTDAEIIEQVTITVVHELAHHFGIDDDRLTELGWD
jgi:predicted Zn-dependent protease with MMP-like domain